MTPLEELADAIEVGMDSVHDMDVTFRDYAEAAAKEVLKMLPALVKPLDFQKVGQHPLQWDAGALPTGWYKIRYCEDGYRVIRGHMVIVATCETLEDAKAAANAHHVAHVMAAMGIEQIGERDE